MTESIKTIKTFTETKFKEKGSVFIGQAFPVESVEEAESILEEVRKKYYDATHHCYAYLLKDESFKYSDDGEPNGTAGIRIYNAIQHFEFVDVLVIVIRYYGGTKLGVGPLGKAYYQSAFQTLESCEAVKKAFFTRIEIIFDYSQTSLAHHLLKQFGATEIKNKFAELPSIEALLEPSKVEKFFEQCKDLSGDKIKTEIIQENILKTVISNSF
jgi:uncharacterized YigZ family protein